MALTLGPATLVGAPGQADQLWSFTIILDGAATTAAALALPTNFPSFTNALGPAAGNTSAQTSAAKRVIYMPGCGGTSAVAVATSVVPGTAASTTLNVAVSAAGTSTQTVQVLALIKDAGF